MTKKILLIGVAVVLAAFVAYAQNGREVYNTTGDGSAATVAIIPAGQGVPVAKSFNYSVATGATVTILRPDIKSTAHSAVDGDTNVLLYVDSVTTNLMGYTITTSDALVFPACGSSNATYSEIDAISTTGVGTNGYIKITCATVFTCASNGTVFVSKNAKKQTIALGTTASVGNEGAWAGYDGCPVLISVPATAGLRYISGVAEYW